MVQDLIEFYDWLMGRQKELFPGLTAPVLPDIGAKVLTYDAENDLVTQQGGEEAANGQPLSTEEEDEYENVFVVVDDSGNKIASLFGVTDTDGQKLHVQADAKWQVPNGSYLKLLDLPISNKPFILLGSEINAIGITGYKGPDINDKDLVNGRKLPGNVGWYGRVHILYGQNKGKSPCGIVFNDSDTWLAVKKVKKSELPGWWFD